MGKGRTNMRAMRAERFSGFEALKLVDLPKPAVTEGKVLVRIMAAGVTPLDHTILFGNFHIPEVPLVLGNEGAGVVEEGGGTDFPAGSRVMFWGTYGAFEDGAYSEWIAVRKEDLCLIPDGVDDVSAAGIPVAYLTAQVALTLADFRPGKTVPAGARQLCHRVADRSPNCWCWEQNTPYRARPTMRKPSRRRRSDSMRSSILPWRSWVTAYVVSRTATVQTLSWMGSVVKS
jgi:D-arabinose 1-dehydrogenase-like Zn-dependent alcohol dehydrogenase